MASTVCEVEFRAVRISWWAASRVGLCLAKMRILAPVYDGAYISYVSTLSLAVLPTPGCQLQRHVLS